jgi:hypothetical protein
MASSFGPWATAVDAGLDPRLSSFWRQRLARLPALRSGSDSALKKIPLAVAALLLLALPLVRTAPAGADEPNKPRPKLFADGTRQSKEEAAIARGLKWLASQQQEDGSWKFQPKQSAVQHDAAATALGVLPFLGAGVKPPANNDRKFSGNVERALDYLIKQQTKDGDWGGFSYTWALATLAMAEAYGLSGDEKYGKSAQRGVEFIVKAQGSDGAWGYSPGVERGDTSNTGWQIQALYSAKKAGLKVPDVVLAKAEKYLTGVMSADGGGYAYTSRGTPTPAMTASGLFSRALIGGDDVKKALDAGIPTVKKDRPDGSNFYRAYYATQMMHHRGGDDWKTDWHPKVREILLGLQVGTQGETRGSWEPDKGPMGTGAGRLGCTSLALLMLEVDYKYLNVMK